MDGVHAGIDNDAPDMLAKCFLKERPWLRGHLLQLRAETDAAAISDAIDDAQAQRGVVQDVSRDEVVSAERRL